MPLTVCLHRLLIYLLKALYLIVESLVCVESRVIAWKLEKKISFTAWFSLHITIYLYTSIILAAYHCQACSLWELSPNKNKACQLQVAISKRKIEEKEEEKKKKEEEEEIYFALPSIPVTRVSNGQGGWADLILTKDKRPPSLCRQCTAVVFLGLTNTCCNRNAHPSYPSCPHITIITYLLS